MKSMSRVLALFLLSLSLTGSAWADRGHGHGHFRGNVHLGVTIDPFWGWPLFYPYPSPYYYPPMYPPVIAVPSQPPVYIEQGVAPEVAVPPSNYWYYCSDSQNYYPYVKECPGGWQRVAPQPAPPQN